MSRTKKKAYVPKTPAYDPRKKAGETKRTGGTKKSGDLKRRPVKGAGRQQKIPRTWLWAGLAAVVLLALAGVLFFLQNQAAEISVTEAFNKWEAGVFLLDVREPAEWEEFHVPGSTLIPLGELAGRVSELPSDQEIVVVCRSGNRSQEGRDILQKAGFKQVSSMANGVNEWKAAGHPTVSGP